MESAVMSVDVSLRSEKRISVHYIVIGSAAWHTPESKLRLLLFCLMKIHLVLHNLPFLSES